MCSKQITGINKYLIKYACLRKNSNIIEVLYLFVSKRPSTKFKPCMNVSSNLEQVKNKTKLSHANIIVKRLSL